MLRKKNLWCPKSFEFGITENLKNSNFLCSATQTARIIFRRLVWAPAFSSHVDERTFQFPQRWNEHRPIKSDVSSSKFSCSWRRKETNRRDLIIQVSIIWRSVESSQCRNLEFEGKIWNPQTRPDAPVVVQIPIWYKREPSSGFSALLMCCCTKITF